MSIVLWDEDMEDIEYWESIDQYDDVVLVDDEYRKFEFTMMCDD